VSAERVRVGVIGGGLIAQTVHLPLLRAMRDRFELVALADPSAKVRDGLAARYRGLRTFADWRGLLAAGGIDALVVCSPHANHAEVVLSGLDAGLHALVEKPLCIDPVDAERIGERCAEAGLVVQVGYMKRYDRGFEALLAGLPADAERLSLIDVVTRDPGMARPPFVPPGFVVSDDLPERVIRESAAQEREQVEATIGVGDPAAVRAFSYTYLACLIHDVNLVHGVLERLGVELPLPPVFSRHWGEGSGASIGFQLPGGGSWNCSWLLLGELEDFSEDATFYFDDQLQRIRFPVPYFRERPTIHEQVRARDGAEEQQRGAYAEDSYAAELAHFHACVAVGEPCRTPPDQGRLDLLALRASFLV